MSGEPTERDLLRMMEVLQEFAEAQGGRIVGARTMEDIEGTTVGDDIDPRISGQSGSAVLGAALKAAGIPPALSS